MALVSERLGGHHGVLSIVGSSFSWAWFDSLFMSALFVGDVAHGMAPEMAAALIYAASAVASLAGLVLTDRLRFLIALPSTAIVIGFLGSAGSLMLLAYSYVSNLLLMVGGGILAGAYMGLAQIAWGAVYCRDGARSATLLVAGSLAGAVILDLPLLAMSQLPRALFFSSFPLVSALLLKCLDQQWRLYDDPGTRGIERPRGPVSYIRNYLGVSITLFVAILLVMVGFGYMQHFFSFSEMPGMDRAGVFIQVARGVVALALFVLVAWLSWHPSTIYRAGLLVMIGGFMMMPMVFGTTAYPIAGVIVISGYTVFDLLKWCVFSQVAHSQSRSPLKTIAMMRLVSSVCYVIGSVVGIALETQGGPTSRFVAGEVSVIGYLVVIATVLLLSSEDIWALFAPSWVASARSHAESPAVGTDGAGEGASGVISGGGADGEGRSLQGTLAGLFEGLGLTAREREVAVLLVRGRTQPWIAEFLDISESTVGTHVRHIYQKAGVHTRTEFLDRLSL